MNIIAALLFKLGLGGTSLDRILGALTKLDKQLEAFEAKAAKDHLREENKIAKAAQRRAAIEADIARADRVRSKVGDLIA